MKLFDIRTDDSHASFIAAVNRALDSEPSNSYLLRFGHVFSPQWWACLERGELPIELQSGKVSFVGSRPDLWPDDALDVIEFECGGQVISLDRSGHLADVPIRIGDQVSITSAVINLTLRTGPELYLIELWGEWSPMTAAE